MPRKRPVPVSCATKRVLAAGASSAGDSETMEATPLQVAQQSAARTAVLRASASATGPKDGIVAVKVCLLLHLSMLEPPGY